MLPFIMKILLIRMAWEFLVGSLVGSSLGVIVSIVVGKNNFQESGGSLWFLRHGLEFLLARLPAPYS